MVSDKSGLPSRPAGGIEEGGASHGHGTYAAAGSKSDFRAFDLETFTRTQRETRGVVRLDALERIAAEVPPSAPEGALATLLAWEARGEVQRETRRQAEEGRGEARGGAGAARASALSVNQPYLLLGISGSVWLTCQRCLRAMEWPVAVEARYRVARTESEADTLAADDDTDVIVGSAAFDLIDLIDEELVLSVPMVPKHEVCPSVHDSIVSGADGRLGVQDLAEVDARLEAAGARQIADDAGGDAVAAPAVGKPGKPGDAEGKRAENQLGKPNPFAALAGWKKDVPATDDEDLASPKENGPH